MRNVLLFSLFTVLSLNLSINISAQENISTPETFHYLATRTGIFADGMFVYKNSNTSVSGKFREGTGGLCIPRCVAGANIDLYAAYYAGPITAGHPGLVNGRMYKEVYFSGFAVLNGGDYTLPYRWTRGRFTVVRPATLSSQINFHSESFNYQNPTVPFFRKPLVLQGTATATFEMTGIGVEPKGNGIPHFRLIDLRFDFSDNIQMNNEQLEEVDQ